MPGRRELISLPAHRYVIAQIPANGSAGTEGQADDELQVEDAPRPLPCGEHSQNWCRQREGDAPVVWNAEANARIPACRRAAQIRVMPRLQELPLHVSAISNAPKRVSPSLTRPAAQHGGPSLPSRPQKTRFNDHHAAIGNAVNKARRLPPSSFPGIRDRPPAQLPDLRDPPWTE